MHTGPRGSAYVATGATDTPHSADERTFSNDFQFIITEPILRLSLYPACNIL
jgi:hypothetical protein